MAQLKVDIRGISQTQLALKDGLASAVQEIAQATHQALVHHTPIDTGNARRNWRTQVRRDGFTSENRVPYIERLENNWSKQTRGRGIVRPALNSIKGKLK